MQFKVHKRKIYIDTFSDKEVVKYLVQILRKGFWEINIYTGGKEDDVIKSLFFDGIPRYYVLFLDLNRMLWEEEKPNAEFLNPIHSKKDVDNLIQFIQDANAASTRVKYQRQFPDYVVADIHGNIDLIEFLLPLLPESPHWYFNTSDVKRLNFYKHTNSCPRYLFFDLRVKCIKLKDTFPNSEEGMIIDGYNVKREEDLYKVLEIANNYSEARLHL